MSVGIGTTSIPSTKGEETALIKSTLGLTKGSNSSAAIIDSLKEDKASKIRQREGVSDILLLTDATIDGYDELIINMDKPLPNLLSEINNSITAVKNAYDIRIEEDCLSNLKWVLVSTSTKTSFLPKSGGQVTTTYQYWKVQKDPAQYRQINYYGAKYYKRPHNRDYGANIIKEIPDASVGIGSTYVIVWDTGFNAISGIKTGDTITDGLESPSVFIIGNLPEVVGFGTTAILGFSTTFEGDISIGSTILKHTGSGIVTLGISTGDKIIRVGITSDATVVGFGTTDAEIEIVDDDGDVGISTATVNTIILSTPAIGSTVLGSFGVGIVTYYPTIFISTTSASGGDHINLTVIRNDANLEDTFDYKANGSDPIEIGLIKNQTKVGYGHSIKIINNGNPDIVTNWREIIDPEPSVGAGFASYYIGAFSWPTIKKPIRVGFMTYYEDVYVQEGYSVVIAIGTTLPQPLIGYASSKPPGAADNATCNTYNSNITSAESTMNSIISVNVPKLNYYANASGVLRIVRDDKENTAWSLRRGTGYLTEQINTLTQQIATLESTDFSEFE